MKVPALYQRITINFVGAGVTATGTGATKTITIPGGTGANPFLDKQIPTSE